jgi:hypothetical protein
LLSPAVLILCWGGCGDSGQPEGESEAVVEETRFDSKWEAGSIEAQFEALINETIDRMRYGDKAGLYDMEFEYFRDETTFDVYLTRGDIRWANADSLSFIEVKAVRLFGEDSAAVDVLIYFEGPGGKKTALDEEYKLYHLQGYWHKPTVSVISAQIDYQNLIRQAEEAAEEEESILE